MNQNDDEDGFLEKTGPKRQSNSNETGAISTVGFALRSESVENPRAALKSNYGLKVTLFSPSSISCIYTCWTGTYTSSLWCLQYPTPFVSSLPSDSTVLSLINLFMFSVHARNAMVRVCIKWETRRHPKSGEWNGLYTTVHVIYGAYKSCKDNSKKNKNKKTHVYIYIYIYPTLLSLCVLAVHVYYVCAFVCKYLSLKRPRRRETYSMAVR